MRARASGWCRLLPIAAALALAGCGGGTRACKQGTVLLTIDFGDGTTGATMLTFDVSIDGGSPKTTMRARSGGASQGTVEIDFPNEGHYPAGKSIDVQVTASDANGVLGGGSTSLAQLPPGCAALSLKIEGSNPAGTGGVGGGGGTGGSTAGHGGGGTGGSAAGTGGSTAGSGGRGGSNAGTGGSTGGSSGRGGSTGGSSGRGGSTGTGGSGGTSSGAPPCRLASFDANTEGFVFNVYNTGGTNLALARDGGAMATMGWSSTEGAPSAGSLRVDAPFTDYDSLVDITLRYPLTALQDWKGLKLHVRAKVVSTVPSNGANPIGVQVYANSYELADGGMVYSFKGNYVPLTTGGLWTDYVLDLAPEGDFDPTRVSSAGVIFSTGEATSNGVANPAKPSPATIYVDSFWLEGTACAPPAGTFPGAATCGSTFAVSDEGFVTAPVIGTCWQGYAQTTSDPTSTTMPGSFSTCGSGCMLRMTGTIGSATAANQYAGYAGINVALWQNPNSGVLGTVTPSGSGLTVAYVNNNSGSLGLRLEIGSSSGFWCYDIGNAPSPVTITYDKFNTSCWDGTGTSYAKNPIGYLRLAVPGGPMPQTLETTLVSVKENN